MIQSGHLGKINEVAYSPDGCLIATAGADNRVKLWDEVTGKVIRTIRAGRSAHTGVRFTPDGRSLVVATERGAIERWPTDADRAELVYASEASESGFDHAGSLAVDADGKRVFAIGGKKNAGVVQVWDLATGEAAGSYGWPKDSEIEAKHLDATHREVAHEPTRIAVAADGEWFATAGSEGRTALWRLDYDAPARFWGEGSEPGLDRDAPYTTVVFGPGRGQMAAGRGTRLTVWKTVLRNAELEIEHGRTIVSAAFNSDGTLIATGGSGGEVKVWSAGDGKELAAFAAHAGAVRSLAFRPRGEKVLCDAQVAGTDGPLADEVLVTGGEDNTARIWSLPTSELIRSLGSRVQPLTDVAFSPDGKLLAIASNAEPAGSAKVWDLTSGWEVTSLRGADGAGVDAVAFSPDGRFLATAQADRATVLWDREALTPVDAVEGRKTSKLVKFVLGATATWIATSESAIKAVGNSLIESALSTSAHHSRRAALAFDPESRYLAIGNRRKTGLWDLESGELLETLDNSGVDDLSFTPDGTGVYSAGGFANLRSVATGEKLAKYSRTFIGRNTGVTSIDVDPRRDRIALGYRDGRIVLKRPHSKMKQRLHDLDTDGSVQMVRFSPDGDVLIAAEASGVVRVFDVTGGLSPVGELVGHSDAVLAADFSPDGELLATASADGTVRLWRIATREEVVVFVSIGADDYIVVTPDNYYAASTNGNWGVAFRRGNQLYPFEQFDLRLNRPDLVFSRLGTVAPELVDGYRKAFERRLRRMNLTEDMLASGKRLPRISLPDLERRLSTTEPELSFTIVAEDDREPIERINVWVNDVPLYGSAGLEVLPPARVARRRVSVRLSEGRNKIQVSALNGVGLESLRATLETIYDKPDDDKPDLYVMVVGVSDYQDDRLDLGYAAKDARDLIAALSAQERFRRVHVLDFLDRAATRENILGARKRLEESRVDDEVVLFVAGHGFLSPELAYYFATADVDPANPAERALSGDELEGLLDGIPARRKLLLLDTCYSGEVDREAGEAERGAGAVAADVTARPVRALLTSEEPPQLASSDAFHLMQQLFSNLGRGSGAVVISAAGGDEFAYEGNGTANGVFTHSLLEAFGDVGDDSFLRLSQLREYVVSRVRQLTGGRQTPNIRRVNLEFDYPIFSVAEPEISDVPRKGSKKFGNLVLQGLEQVATGTEEQ